LDMNPLRQIANSRAIIRFLFVLLDARRQVIFWLVLGLAIVAADSRGEGFLIPDTTRRDLVFDFAGQNLYISTSTGLIKAFHLVTRTFGPSYNLGGSLNAIDIARDDSFILAAQDNVGVSQGSIQRVNLRTGMITNINYTRDFGEAGAWDVAIGSNGLALFTTQFSGSGWTPLRQIDLSSNAIAIRTDAPGSAGGGQLSAPTQIHRSADGTRFLFMEGNFSDGPVFTYNAATNTFGASFEGNGYLDRASGAVNRNGSLIAVRLNGPTAASLNTAPDFNFLHSFNGLDNGVAFDAHRDVLYGVNSETDEIIAYSTTTFAELFRLSIGEDIPGFPPAAPFQTGTLVASGDGRWLALETDSGIRVFQASPTPTPTPSAARAAVADFNNDGHPDYVLRKTTTLETAIWYLNNNVYIGSAYGPTLPARWWFACVADFNRDTHPDYALMYPNNRQTLIGYLSGPTVIGAGFGPTLSSGDELAAASDFNNDGYPDYALYKPSTRQTAIWYLDDTLFLGADDGPPLPVGWSLIGTADFNADGHPDYALFNAATGQTLIGYLSGPTVIGAAFGPTAPGGWLLVAIADFNGDGHPDYLLYSPTARQTAIWYLNNNVYVSAAYGPTLPASWSLVAQ
jgi:VCBS repeat protein